ncbi:uncharacterized protein [Rutidosis leptorrhynchoides]|uniref:uncharacterized protein n=1 Tax=Rutidosis leptorrhynchoides TaxID=125765 RepID=UPI003A9950C7
MGDSSSVDVILEFLKSNKFLKAEAALRSEIGNRNDINGFMKGLKGEEVAEKSGLSDDVSNEEFVVKEMELENGRKGSDSKRKNAVEEKNGTGDLSGTLDNGNNSSNNSDETLLDLYSRNFSNANGSVDIYQNDTSVRSNDVKEYRVSSQSKIHPSKSTNNSRVNAKVGVDKIIEPKEYDSQYQVTGAVSRDGFVDVCRNGERKDCTVKTVFPFLKGDTSTNYGNNYAFDEKEDGKQNMENSIRSANKDQVDDEDEKDLYFATTHENYESKAFGGLGFPIISEKHKEELPRLPPVKLKSEDKPSGITWEEKYQRDGPSSKNIIADSSYLIGSFLDVPIGQELSTSGGKRLAGGNWFSVSQGITEDTSDLVSGFATIGDGLSESVDYPNDYWDSDEYDDDDDVGYMRQPIEDETWFLAHEIDYPSDNEKKTGHENSRKERGPEKNEDDDDLSFAEEDSYLSGDQYFHLKSVDPVSHSDNVIGPYDGHLMDEEELNLMRSEPVWKGFVSQTDELIMLSEGQFLNKAGRPHLNNVCIDEDQHDSVRSIGVGINSDVADFGSEVRESLVGGSSEGDLEYYCDNDVGISSRDSQKKYINRAMKDKRTKNANDNGFSFPPPRDGQPLTDPKNTCNAIVSSSSSPVKSSRDEDDADAVGSANSSPSTLTNYRFAETGHQEDRKVGGLREEPGASLEDEEAAAVQEQVNQIKAQEEEYETFNLKIVHRKNRTGFEEDKNFNVVLNSVIAGRYHVTEYLGSAAFSKAIQAHDLHSGMDVCVKIIKNNKDFFDQSLDEIKLLKYINKHDPGDKYHLLRLYDYFYYREHLLIVCELLKANLYEFHKFNRESGGEVYFTMPRLQSITIQCLEALQFLHGLGLIHCDLKPENILVKSYSRCEVKVIDLGSSCFESDHLCSYVQSRSYRAPEVILGLPYDKKIDIWSLGCILAELCTGNVLFQNDSPATLLARVIGIISPIGQDMLAKGRDTSKYFSKNHMLYERNQDTNRLEYLIPKKTSLRHRLPMGDQGFIDFVSHLLEIDPKKRPSAAEALKHPWLSYPYEPISS